MASLLRIPSLVVVALIRLYQRTLAKALPNRCRFHPSCSEYAAQSIALDGVMRGGARAMWRVARCGPWTAGGLDPVRARPGRSTPAEAR